MNFKTLATKWMASYPDAQLGGDTDSALKFVAMCLETVARYFKFHPQIDEFYCTANGQVFSQPNAAFNHADSLDDKRVALVNRKDLSDTGENSPPKMIMHIVTEEDLANDASLGDRGVVVGDEIEIPAPEEAKVTPAIKKPYSKMNKTELQGECNVRKIEFPADDDRKKLIAKLEFYDKQQA